MSGDSNIHNPTLDGLRKLSSRFDGTTDALSDFFDRQARGEQPDREEFMKVLEKRATTQEAMEAQFKLHEKPLKTVLDESK